VVKRTTYAYAATLTTPGALRLKQIKTHIRKAALNHADQVSSLKRFALSRIHAGRKNQGRVLVDNEKKLGRRDNEKKRYLGGARGRCWGALRERQGARSGHGEV